MSRNVSPLFCLISREDVKSQQPRRRHSSSIRRRVTCHKIISKRRKCINRAVSPSSSSPSQFSPALIKIIGAHSLRRWNYLKYLPLNRGPGSLIHFTLTQLQIQLRSQFVSVSLWASPACTFLALGASASTFLLAVSLNLSSARAKAALLLGGLLHCLAPGNSSSDALQTVSSQANPSRWLSKER